MERQALTDPQLEELRKCLFNVRSENSILFASSTLFFFNYVLTIFDEIKFLRRSKLISLGTITFVVARYSALLAAILSVSPTRDDPTVAGVNSAARLTSIVASELILATRTWAIWGRSRKILWTLILFSLSASIPCAIIVGLNAATNSVRPLITPELEDLCSATFGDAPGAFIIAYVVAIVYEIVTHSLSSFRIAKWRKRIPETIRAPLLDILWRDGVLYFTFMLLLSFMNIAIILQPETPQLRTSGANLQAVLHSVVSTRILLHLANSKNPRNITDTQISAYSDSFTDIGAQFTTHLSLSMDQTIDRRRDLEEGEDGEDG